MGSKETGRDNNLSRKEKKLRVPETSKLPIGDKFRIFPFAPEEASTLIRSTKDALSSKPRSIAAASIDENDPGLASKESCAEKPPLHPKETGRKRNREISTEIETAKRVLRRTSYRPDPSEVKNLTKKDINTAATELSYPVYDISKYERVHKQALPLIAEKARVLLEENERRKPKYIIFGRDGEMMYDVLASVASGTELAQRIYLLNINKAHAEQVELGTALAQQIHQPNIPRSHAEQLALRLDDAQLYKEQLETYLRENGISSETLQTEDFVFFDSGYRGSIFDLALQIGGTTKEAMRDRMRGYLLIKGERKGVEPSPYNELGWPEGMTMDEHFFTHFYEEFAKNWEDLGSLGPNVMIPRLDPERKINWALAGYLQIQPKYTRPGFTIERIDGKWRSVPTPNERNYPIQNFHLWEVKDVTQPIPHPNSCVVDPIAALKLQTETINYVTQPEVKSAILRDIL